MHLNNHHPGIVHLHDAKSGKRLSLKPGVSEVNEQDLKLHAREIARLGLQEVQPLNDMPAKKPEHKLEDEAPKAKRAKKVEELKEDLEPLHE